MSEEEGEVRRRERAPVVDETINSRLVLKHEKECCVIANGFLAVIQPPPAFAQDKKKKTARDFASSSNELNDVVRNVSQ